MGGHIRDLAYDESVIDTMCEIPHSVFTRNVVMEEKNVGIG